METGYAFITSNKGYCVAHPDKDVVTKNITEAFPEAVRNEILNDIKNGKTYHNTLVSPETVKNTTMFSNRRNQRNNNSMVHWTGYTHR